MTAVEIGSYMGESASVIAGALADGGCLYCVDPWTPLRGREDPCLSIFKREVRRRGQTDRIRIVQAISMEAGHLLPREIDFSFIDGDHSYDGLRADWKTISERTRSGGIICLHDVFVPDDDPSRNHGSMRFFKDVIASAGGFEQIDACRSMAVMRKAC